MGESEIIEVHLNLFVGTDRECNFRKCDEWAIVHACKLPCHQRALGYRGNLSKFHPNYLTYEVENHLFLNMIDPPTPLFKPQLFTASLDFIEKHISERKVLIHCNLGLSRAPSIALLYLAKRTDAITNDSYKDAIQEFIKLFPRYNPSRGIAIYLSKNWQKFQ